MAAASDERFQTRPQEGPRGRVDDQIADDQGSGDPCEGRADAVGDARRQIEKADGEGQEGRDDKGREEEQRRRAANAFEGGLGPRRKPFCDRDRFAFGPCGGGKGRAEKQESHR